MSAPQLRVVVRLPGTRPDNPIPDPPQIEWTQEKADILWKVIEKSRSSDSGGADWKGLAAHLEVPLPYLLYRVNARFHEEIRGLKDIQDTLSPTGAQPTFPSPLFAAETTGAPPTSPRPAERPGPSALQRLQTKLSLSLEEAPRSPRTPLANVLETDSSGDIDTPVTPVPATPISAADIPYPRTAGGVAQETQMDGAAIRRMIVANLSASRATEVEEFA
ncbi:hypothetical protein NMY22_g16390 [Coprinellus aureogranulatus]|nr:hypothetical protein NMY22_g16390 [Coprinellus aureogranulatus]